MAKVQPQLTTMKDPDIPLLTKLGIEYCEMVSKHQKRRGDIAGKREVLEAKMREHELDVYRIPGTDRRLIMDKTEKLKTERFAEVTE